ADYWKRYQNEVVDLGILYSGARLGWVVPNYIPTSQLESFADLKKPEIRKKLKDKIQGIDSGAGITRLSQLALSEYDLDDYRLMTASGAAMTAALQKAIQNKEWIVVTGWSPHWMFAKWDLRYLKDPKKSLGEGEE